MTALVQFQDASADIVTGAFDLKPADNCPKAPSVQAFVVNAADVASEGGTDPVFGTVTWKTLISGEKTNTSEFVLGIAEFGPGGTLHPHVHAPAEFYFGLTGSGIVTIDGVAHEIVPGVAIYIPGNAEHGTVAGPDGLRFAYGFAEAAFGQIEYRFSARVA
ncbi:cupin domain-containing protein [Defluviimonas sp. WL0050]|uniref:Cupin domain-containing protein n=1 Tax=Albidovulum litorale TaxID=2984134 RepID=A0ABT2ZIV8_9RHOB|nr:cupin domain-containing protein [Defluviimonas sp. WL0050]MCV2870985.1 cupin domain-containing protein [Defluviimonas sp. WL0050]